MKKIIISLIALKFCFNTINISAEEKKLEDNNTIIEYVKKIKQIATVIIKDFSTWYKENKDELKEISKEIIEEDKEILTGIKEDASNMIDKGKTWYEENKDELKETSKEIIEKDKNAIKNFFGDVSSWYEENKEELKNTSKQIYENDKETIKELFNKLKKNE